MVFRHIKKVKNKHARRGIYSFLGLNALFLHLVFLKTLVFNIFSLKLLVLESAVLMSVFGLVPHVTFAQATVDYSITNSTYPVTAQEGDIITFMYYYQNESDPYTPGSNITITANIPAGTTYESSQGGGEASVNNGQAVWNIPAVDTQNGFLLLRVLVSPGAGNIIENTVTITHAANDPNTDNDSEEAIVIVNASESEESSIDLTIDKVADKSQASIMDNITYTLTYTNQGTQLAQDVKVYELLPAELYVISASPTRTSKEGNLYTWNVGSVGTGESDSVEITMSPFPNIQADTVIENYAGIGSNMVESDAGNNGAQETITIYTPTPEMDIEISNPTSVCINQNATFTVNLQNAGQSIADDLVIKHTLTNALSYVSSSKSSQGGEGERTRTYLTDFYPGDSTSFTVVMKGSSTQQNQNIVFRAENGDDEIGLGQSTITVLPASDPSCDDEGLDPTNPPEVYGCTDPSDESNYDPEATIDDGSCEDDTSTTDIVGCMDDTAENYDAQATIADNSSCTYGEEGQIYGCTDQNAENYNPDATDLNGSCTYILGCTDPDAENYNSNATQSNNSCTYEEDEEDDEDEILGCTNPNAPNYDSQATQDNGSCQGPIIYGCTDPNAQNYNENATHDNGNCSLIGYNNEEDTTTKTETESQEPKQNIPGKTECNLAYNEVFDYAQKRGLIDYASIEEANICGPLTRVQFAQYIVDIVLTLGIPESNPNQDCNFQDLSGLTNEQIFYAQAVCNMGLMGVDGEGNSLDFFNPHDFMTRRSTAIVFSRTLFGDRYATCESGPYDCYVQSVHTKAYLMGNINNLEDPITLAALMVMTRRMDLGEVPSGTKWIRWIDQGRPDRDNVGTTIDVSQE